MKREGRKYGNFRFALIAGVCVAMAVVVLELVFARAENDFFQFCTTKAYGWPAPWRVDFCECEGAKTVYPLKSVAVNVGAIASGGLAAFFGVFFGGGLFRRADGRLCGS